MTEANKNTLKSFALFLGAFLAIMGIQLLFKDYIGSMSWCFGMIIGTIFVLTEAFNEAKRHWYQMASSVNDGDSGHVAFRINDVILAIAFHQFVGWQSIVCYGLMYLFIHDGMYYWKRNQLDSTVYKKGFWDFTATPEAWTDRLYLGHPVVRTFLFVIGFAALIVFNYFNR